ncbi:cupin domain family protein [Desulforapulum autotrophicum HRM2]|uniref:Cupin domain family protein n=1 Tax=Desulforapulum autotrophicum (strain ATCC 43914 / DSM 3382 / VKM B-1955 / HRM2) TaxID=177437 RepID=C0QD84_DESAH|nr:cupin domain-containing protein [Desulforapulum autotrophicum]ACN17316.1 cupin domain family protein [Desulforapulum autotrophicum HRM2]
MKIVDYKGIEPTRFDNGVAKGITGRVVIGKEDGANNFCMRVFEVEKNGHTPRHSHEWEHEIFFHSGMGEVLCQGKWTPVSSGAAVFVPGNEDHQIQNTGQDTLVFVCLIPKGAPEI